MGSTKELQECAICFDPLPHAPTAVLTRNGRRVCRHFFCATCVTNLANVGTQRACPCCRARFDGCLKVPDVKANPRAWFKLVDFDGNGGLNQVELLEILKATMDLDIHRLEQHLPQLFARFDTNGDGAIKYEEMMGPDGLFFHLSEFRRNRSGQGSDSLQPSRRIPDIRTDKEAWFRYWDEDRSAALGRVEVLRSFVKTFGFSANPGKLQELSTILEAIWHEFDSDGSGEIEMEEFCQPNGLADVIIANLGL